jgi:hypothetical protein
MIETIIIPIIINEGSKYFYFLMLIKKIEESIRTVFKLKVSFKLLNKPIKIKSQLDYTNMFNFQEHILKIFYTKKIKYDAKKQIKTEKRKKLYDSLYDEIKAQFDQLEDSKVEKKMLDLGFCRCDNKRCQLYTSPAKQLEDILTRCGDAIKEDPSLNASDLKKLTELVSNSQDAKDFDRYAPMLRGIEITCRGCKHQLNDNIICTPKHLISLNDKSENLKCVA